MPDRTITRRECPVHGDTISSADWCVSSESHDAPCRERVNRTYVAVDTLLSDEAVLEAAARAYAGERWWDSLPVDNEQKESHRRAMADAIEAALGAALPGTEARTDG